MTRAWDALLLLATLGVIATIVYCTNPWLTLH
jgi:hypothetical protein